MKKTHRDAQVSSKTRGKKSIRSKIKNRMLFAFFFTTHSLLVRGGKQTKKNRPPPIFVRALLHKRLDFSFSFSLSLAHLERGEDSKKKPRRRRKSHTRGNSRRSGLFFSRLREMWHSSGSLSLSLSIRRRLPNSQIERVVAAREYACICESVQRRLGRHEQGERPVFGGEYKAR